MGTSRTVVHYASGDNRDYEFEWSKAVLEYAYLCRACFENSCKNMGVELPKLDYMED